MRYTIIMPSRFYGGLQDRDAFCDDNPQDKEARAVFEAAERVKHARGFRYLCTADNRKVLTYMVDYFDSLLQLVECDMLPASELGVRREELAVIASQRIKAYV